MSSFKAILYVLLSVILMIPIGFLFMCVYYIFMKIICFLFRKQIADFLMIKTGPYYKKNPGFFYDNEAEIRHNERFVCEYPLSYLDSVLKKDDVFSTILKYRLAMEEQLYYGSKKKNRISSKRNLPIELKNLLRIYIQVLEKEYHEEHNNKQTEDSIS